MGEEFKICDSLWQRKVHKFVNCSVTYIMDNPWAFLSILRLLLYCIVLYCIVLYLSISMALFTAWAFQKRSRPQQLTRCWSLHAEALQAIASEGLAQSPYVAARAGMDSFGGLNPEPPINTPIYFNPHKKHSANLPYLSYHNCTSGHI